MHDPKTLDLSWVAQDLQIRKIQVESAVQLLDDGNTVAFVARYRKERTGGLTEDQIRQVQARVARLRQFSERKQTVLKSIEGQGQLTEELRTAILAAESPRRLDDLYLPFKPKKKSIAAEAREKGLEPLALAVLAADPAVANLGEVLPSIVNPDKGLSTPEDVLAGVRLILAEMVAETADVRGASRAVLWNTGRLVTSRSETLPEGKGLEYKDYFRFMEPVLHIPPHRILAVNRGEKEGAIKVRLEFDAEAIRRILFQGAAGSPPILATVGHPNADLIRTAADEGLTRILLPALEREIRRELTEQAQAHAVSIFARNVRSLLLQAPLHGQRVLAIHPGFRTGCKVAALDEAGNLLEHAVIFPHPPRKKRKEALSKLQELMCRHQTAVIAIGSGAACRETEELVSEFIALLTTSPSSGMDPASPALPADVSSPSPPAGTAAAASLGEFAVLDAPPLQAPATLSPVQPEQAHATPAAILVEPTASGSAQADAGQALGDRAAPEPSIGPSPLEGPIAVPLDAGARDSAGASQPESALPALPPQAPLPPPPPDLAYTVVSEAGLNVYASGPPGREEFPDYDTTLRATMSLGRRLQDPLSELVKVEPHYIGVGLYQHDVDSRSLRESLEAVVESAVNHVGVNLNVASVALLKYVSGLNALAAREVADHRSRQGAFQDRHQLQQLPAMVSARYEQAAGFVTVTDGTEPLDRTRIHPESYGVARQILSDLGYGAEVLLDPTRLPELRERLKGVSPEETGPRLGVGVLTLVDILEALGRPNYDPREDLPKPVLKRSVLKIEDLQSGAELRGTIQNVVDFGAFVDVGLKDSGLVHISQMANRYVKSPHDVAAVGDVVTVWVLSVDSERKRVSLTMIRPGTERKPPERKPREHRPQGQAETGARPGQPSGPPRGRRPGPGRRPLSAGTGGRPTPATATAGAGPPPPHTRRPPTDRPASRRSARPRPRPNLSQEALEGEAPLRTFGELKAFFEAKRPVAPAAVPETSPPAETALEAPPPMAPGEQRAAPPP